MIKAAGLRLLSSHGASRLLMASVARRQVSVFYLHRFGDLDTYMGTCRLPELSDRLELLRGMGVRFLRLGDVVSRLDEPGGLGELTAGRPGVAFAVDDGYRDLLDALPVFAAHACPVSVFLCTEFVDGTRWMWWDKVEYVIRARDGEGQLRVAPTGEIVRWSTDRRSRVEAYDRICASLKSVPSAEVEVVLEDFAGQRDVELPDEVPEEYGALTWEEVESLEGPAVQFGAHTLTHPILSRCDDERSEREIRGSSRVVNERLRSPLDVFAYPNGDELSFGDREKATIRGCGLEAAVSTVPDYVSRDGAWKGDAYAIPRFPYPEDRASFFTTVNGTRGVIRAIRRAGGVA
ncbi:MAG: hypothetical protein AMS19_06320 [Gemmatimonas sp. SG8_23]|nr:MAG: hypothetical protein AMS19_06320 [Gemmatimonas sp. SG8_23]